MDQVLDSRIAKQLRGGFEDDSVRKFARCEGANGVVRGIDPERVYTPLA
jgi:hypothetical protein